MGELSRTCDETEPHAIHYHYLEDGTIRVCPGIVRVKPETKED